MSSFYKGHVEYSTKKKNRPLRFGSKSPANCLAEIGVYINQSSYASTNRVSNRHIPR